MPNLTLLDDAKRLLPWLLVEHRGFVLGEYGRIKGTMGQDAADEYIAGYKKKEVEADAAYEDQRAKLRLSATAAGMPPQELPDLVKIVWDPSITDATQPSGVIAQDIAQAEVRPVDATPIVEGEVKVETPVVAEVK